MHSVVDIYNCVTNNTIKSIENLLEITTDIANKYNTISNKIKRAFVNSLSDIFNTVVYKPKRALTAAEWMHFDQSFSRILLKTTEEKAPFEKKQELLLLVYEIQSLAMQKFNWLDSQFQPVLLFINGATERREAIIAQSVVVKSNSFSRMIQEPLSETSIPTIDLSCLESLDVFDVIIAFFKNDQQYVKKISDTTVIQLLQFAHMYDFDELAKSCESWVALKLAQQAVTSFDTLPKELATTLTRFVEYYATISRKLSFSESQLLSKYWDLKIGPFSKESASLNAYIKAVNAIVVKESSLAFELKKKIVTNVRRLYSASPQQLNHLLRVFYGGIGKYVDAKKYALKAIELNPNQVEFHFHLASICFRLKEYVEAKRSYQTAVKLDPDNALCYCNLGNVHLRVKEYPEAEKSYKKAIQLDPSNALYHSNLGNIYFTLKRYDEAKIWYQTAVKLDPINALCHGNLGNFQYHLKTCSEAKKSYKEAIRLAPTNAFFHNKLGNVHFALKEYVEAKKSY
ncbi:MAG: transrane and repeat-containing protein 4, partial [Chlamydiia bacterium]|nr:transrane and repeat-containing protein 4 [Chlamydiia bacterium]